MNQNPAMPVSGVPAGSTSPYVTGCNPVQPQASWVPFSTAAMEEALLARLESANRFAGVDRTAYVGASEIGGCPRLASYLKANPEERVIDAGGAGRMRRGSVLENEVIQILRCSNLGAFVRDTGNNQAHIEVPDAPMRIHPDGSFTRLPVPDGVLEALVMDASGALVTIPVSALDGPGVIEVKTYGMGAFTALRKKGLSPAYQDQVTSQLGATGRKWALVIAVCADDLSRMELFVVLYDAERFEMLKERARAIMRGKESLILEEDPPVLPDPMPERSYDRCESCPIAYQCPAHAVADAVDGAVLPEEDALEAELLAEEYALLAPQAKRLEEVKDRLKAIFRVHPVASHVCPMGAKLTRAFTAARASCDLKALQEQFPDAYAATVTTGEPSMWVRFTAPKGKR